MTLPDINQLFFMMGQWQQKAEGLADTAHTCQQSYLRYPWPPDEKCEACRRSVERHVARAKLDPNMPWADKVADFKRAIDETIAHAEANRNIGAGI